jgi:peptidoglycan/LPS O-acetylase OafA/YrhL
MTGAYRYRTFGTFRLFLAVLVVISHLETDFASPWLARILHPLGIGNIGVATFFILSGFVITEALTCFYDRRIWAFALNRSLRIVPPYLVALLFSAVVHGWLFRQGLPILGTRWTTFVNPLGMNLVALFDPRIPAAREDYYIYVRYVWAIVTEVQFYAAAGLLFWSSRVLPLRRRGRQAMLITYVVATMVLYVASTSVTMPALVKVIEFSPYFLTGICLYYWIRQREAGARSGPLPALTVVSAGLSIVCFARYIRTNNPYPLLAYVAALMVFGALAFRTKGPSAQFQRLDAALGDLSYPLYLNHFAIEVLLLALVGGASALALWGGVALSIAAALALSAVVEPLTRGLREMVRGSAIRSAAPPAATEVIAS